MKDGTDTVDVCNIQKGIENKNVNSTRILSHERRNDYI